MADKKIAIVAANNIRLSPYILFYSKLLDECGVKYDLIYPDRNGYKDEWDGTVYRIQWNPHIHSLINYRLYAKKAIRIIQTNKYSKLIILTSPIAVYMSLWLRQHRTEKE